MSRFVLTAQLQLQAPNNVAQVVRQIQNQLNNVQVNVQVQGVQQAQRQIQQLTRNTNNATSAAERMGRAFAVSVRRFAAFSIATRAVGLFTSTLADAVQTSIDFERQLIKISQVTGKSIGGLRDLTNEITNLSTSLGVSSGDLLEVTTVLAQAGLSADDTKKALNSLAKAALAPNFDSISETAEGAIAILAQFGKGVDALESQLGSINAVAGAFAVEASDLIDVIRRTGGVFKSSGGDLNELLALFTSVRATTRESAESIGTGLRTIFTRIQRPKTIEFLKQFGVELVDLEGKFVGPFEAVRRLSGALAGLGEGDITFIRIAEELGGFRQIGKVLPLLQQFSVAQQALNVANKAGNSLTQDAATAQQALAIRITKVKEEFLALIRSITETSTFQIMANTALTLASALIKVADAVKPLLPLLAALTAVRLVRGIGSFIGGIGGGLTSGRTFNKGGKVHKFARGGMVPGSGNRDTVPAMLQPGEFVIRKSSVNRLGASNLAAMNENRYANGGLINENTIGAAILENVGFDSSNSVKVSRQDIENKLPKNLRLSDNYPIKSQKSFTLQREGLSGQTYNSFSRIIDDNLVKVAENSAQALALDLGLSGSRTRIPPDDINRFLIGINDASRGNLFEDTLKVLSGSPFSTEPQRAFDFETGLSNVLKDDYKNLTSKYVDAKSSLAQSIPSKFQTKASNALAFEAVQNNLVRPETENEKKKRESLVLKSSFSKKKHFGGMISKFAFGGLAKAPLIDDIVNATGTMMPRPSSAIAALIKAGGGAIDIDRTLKRTIGDQAYGRAKTSGQQSAALNKYFRDPTARLRDIKSAPLTAFGRELQTAIKSGQLQPGKLSIISKSQRVPGVAEYLSQLFGIPLGNMIFTQGGSKQPAMDALRGKGPRAMRKFATGGGVGTDTVPALLTPGEFVINRSAAKSIGYGSLNRMNKIGKYAKGGVVHRFNNGGAAPAYSGSGPVMSAAGGDYIPFDTLSRQARNLSNAQQALVKTTQASNTTTQQVAQTNDQQKKSLVENVAANKMFAASMTVGLLQSFLPALDENASAATRMAHELLGLVSTITTVGFALEAFGVSLSLKNIKDLFGTGPKSIGGILQNATRGLTGGGQIGGGGPLGKGAFRAGSFVNRSASSIGNRLGSIGSSINQSQIGRGFSAGLNMPNVTFSRIASSSKSVGEKAGGFLGKSLSVGGQALSRIPGAGLVSKGLSSAASFAGNTGSQFTKGISATLKNPSKAVIGSGASTSAQAGGLIGKGLANLTKLNGIAIGVGLAFTGITSVVDSFIDYQNKANKAIQEGNIQKAKSNAVEAAGADAVNSLGSSIIAASAFFGPYGIAVGAATAGLLKLGSELPVVGPLIKKFAIGLGTFFGGNTLNSIEALAASQAGAVKTQKALEQAQKTATSAMQDFENGTITASEALSRIRAATDEANNQEKRASDFATKNLENRGGGVSGVGRNILSFLSFGGVESVSQRNERLGKQSAEQIRQASKFQSEAFALESPARSATIRSGFARGKTAEEIRNEALGVGTSGDKLARLQTLSSDVNRLGRAGDEEGAKAAEEALKQLREEIRQVDDEMKNLEKEVARAKAAFDAMNLGLRGPTATATAMSASMDRFAAGLEVGGNTFVANAEFLSQAVGSAAQAMNPADIKAAIDDVASNLEKMGVNPEKFRANTEGFIKVQQNYNKSFSKVRSDLQARLQAGQSNADSADDVRKALIDELTSGLEGDAKKNLTSILDNLKLNPEDIDKFISTGDFSAFGDQITEAGKKQLEDIVKISQERQKAEQVLINLTKTRIDAERNLVQAQQEALDLYLEGREIQAGAGGRAVSEAERRSVILGKSNAQGDRVGLSSLRTGSAAELRRRNVEMVAGAARFEQRSRTEGGLEGVGGVQAAENQKDLQQAYKQQVDTIRSLIKLEQEELKIVQEKNRLEKESLESLIKGDIDKFFEQQAAVGATAAISTGNQDLINQFGATALAGAFENIQRQQAAGVQEIFGMQLGGPGGLLEMAAGAALGARGVTDAGAARSLAGTTPEEEARRATIRELGGVLAETGQAGVDMAQMELNTASINVQKGEFIIQDIEQRGRIAAGMYRGGTVYANNGMFVPRGTDTVPAMLTPGEFVVNRAAVNRGNNLQLLRAINSGANSAGLSKGGSVRYYNNGGKVQYLQNGGVATGQGVSIDPALVSDLINGLNNFNINLTKNIKDLQNTKFQIKLDTTNINVNLSGGTFLSSLAGQIKKEILTEVGEKIKNYKVVEGGRLQGNMTGVI